jgi:hypothetical protein
MADNGNGAAARESSPSWRSCLIVVLVALYFFGVFGGRGGGGGTPGKVDVNIQTK